MDPTWIEVGSPDDIEASKHPDYPNNISNLIPPSSNKRVLQNSNRKGKSSDNYRNGKNTTNKKFQDRDNRNRDRDNRDRDNRGRDNRDRDNRVVNNSQNHSRDGSTIYDKNVSTKNNSNTNTNPYDILNNENI